MNEVWVIVWRFPEGECGLEYEAVCSTKERAEEVIAEWEGADTPLVFEWDEGEQRMFIHKDSGYCILQAVVR